VDRATIMNRIAHLMNKTLANGASEAEAASACEAAQRLMDKYNIAVAELVTGTQEERVTFAEQTVFSSRWTEQSYLRAIPVVKFMFPVEAYYFRPTAKGNTFRIVIFGDPANVDSASWTLNFLGQVYKRLWTEYRKLHETVSGDITNYYVGLTQGLITKLKEDRAVAAEERTPGTGLAVIEKSLAVIRASMTEEFQKASGKNVRKATTKVSWTQAYSQGVSDGRTINIARPLAGNTSITAIG
jgi:hypothetical protein